MSPLFVFAADVTKARTCLQNKTKQIKKKKIKNKKEEEGEEQRPCFSVDETIRHSVSTCSNSNRTNVQNGSMFFNPFHFQWSHSCLVLEACPLLTKTLEGI